MTMHRVLLAGHDLLARSGGRSGGGRRSGGGYRGGSHGAGGGIMPVWVWVLIALIVVGLIIWAIARRASSD